MADKVNLYADQGTDFEIKFVISYSNNQLVDLTSYDVYGSLKKYYTSNNQINMTMEKDVANSIIVAKIPSTVSSSLDGRYVYDIKMVDTNISGKTTRVVEGIITITPEVTKNT